MRNANLVKLYEGYYVSFSKKAAGFSVIPGTTGWVGLDNGERVDLSLVKPYIIYDAHIEHGYCTNNELTIYNAVIPVEEIEAIITETGTLRLLTEDSNNFLVTQYRS
jgi:hypothetical protein